MNELNRYRLLFNLFVTIIFKIKRYEQFQKSIPYRAQVANGLHLIGETFLYLFL